MGKCVRSAFFCGVAAAAVFVLTGSRSAEARPQYVGMWVEKYPEVSKAHDVTAKVKCLLCHTKTGSKPPRNAYGKAIEKAFDGKKMLKKSDAADFAKFLDKAGAEKSETEGKTFGDLLKAKELPAKSSSK